MKNKNLFGMLALLVVGLVVSAGVASAFGFGFGANEESREQIHEAIEAGDFTAWKEAVSSQLTEENFNEIVERHEVNAERFEHRAQIRQAMEDATLRKPRSSEQN